ncbi:hypothetical protein CA85_05420 [Allorhodopirellula solitaria]|uniref:Uncharacterized protein n=1 Tax=Allorhodopirellula solitaria TaxID=2527987 RepID=A0A5C5YK18_9BACT|nr:hypothetical protein CA85_05420 [Allorhodopirellula solitaria]
MTHAYPERDDFQPHSGLALKWRVASGGVRLRSNHPAIILNAFGVEQLVGKGRGVAWNYLDFAEKSRSI